MSGTPMRQRFAEIDAIFAEALELEDSGAQRALVLARTEGDPELRQEILSLLAADAEAAALFESDDRLWALPTEPLSLAGKRIGPYQVGAELGRGGMATVYEAQRVDGELEQTVAIKVLRRADAELRARFRAERQTLVGLRHPYIVAPLGAGTLEDGRPYLVLEKVEGEPLLEACARRGLDLEASLLLFEKICQAVTYAHNRLVVHRDLKPSNILVDAQGEPRLLDFGIAKLLGSPGEGNGSIPSRDAAITGVGGAPFTPRYASPEQIRGEPVSTATDVYSLGLVLGELLALPGLGPLDEDLRAIVQKASEEDPARRYPAVEALRQDLENRRNHQPLLARAPDRLYVASRFLRRHRGKLALALFVLLALLLAAITSRRAEQRALESEKIAWRAHAEAAWVTNTLAGFVSKLARGETGQPEVQQVLEEAEKHLRNELMQKAPEAEARLRHALALAYLEMGQKGPAQKHAERAAELARGTRGLGPEDLENNLEILRRLGSSGGKE